MTRKSRAAAKGKDAGDIIPLPPNVYRENGGVRCDMLKGPCACGAWHDGLARAAKVVYCKTFSHQTKGTE